MKRLLYLIFLLPGLLACSKKQPAGSDAAAEVVFNLSFNRSLSAYQTVDVKAASPLVRNFVCVYKVNSAGQVANQEKPDYSFSWEGEKASYTATLPVGSYRVMAWSDQQQDGASALWDPSDFTAIKMAAGHVGSDECVRAFMGKADLSITDDGNRALTVPMASPQGKFVIVSAEKQQAQTDGLSVRITYSAYMPSAFGMFEDKPVDSQTGVSFVVLPQPADDGTVLMGFDYVLTNGTEASVPLHMEVLTEDGTPASDFNFTVPMVRGKITTVRGEFLSGASHSAVTIDTSFEDEYNFYF